MIFEANEVQSHIEALMTIEEAKKEELQEEMKKYKKVSAQQAKPKKVEFRQNIFITSQLITGKRVFFSIIDGTLKQLQQKMSSVFKAPENSSLGFVYNGKTIALRNDADVYALGYHFFANNLVSIEIVVLDKTADLDIPAPKNTKDIESTVVFHSSNLDYSVFADLKDAKNFENGKQFIEKVFGKPASIEFVDSEEDRIEIDGDDSWDYMLEQNKRIRQNGQYLIVELVY